MNQEHRDYFMGIAEAVSKKSRCHSRKIGAVIVKDGAIISTGYNGPPRGVDPCAIGSDACCPRKVKGIESGKCLDECPAQHAERNAISQAARQGTSTMGATLYLNDIIPCKDCLGAIINAGITKVVCTELKFYNMEELSKRIIVQARMLKIVDVRGGSLWSSTQSSVI